jgi:hypothetical protein
LDKKQTNQWVKKKPIGRKTNQWVKKRTNGQKNKPVNRETN